MTSTTDAATARQLAYIADLCLNLGERPPDAADLTRADASALIDALRRRRSFRPRTCAGDPCECEGMQIWGECVRA